MKIGYACKYVPIEAMEAMGARMVRIEPAEDLASFDAAETCMHANICSFVKAAFETVSSGDFDGVVLTTCCDSMRRLADALQAQAPRLFIHLLDVPRDTGDAARTLYDRNVRKLLSAYGEFADAEFSEDALFTQLGGTICPAEGTCEPTRGLDPKDPASHGKAASATAWSEGREASERNAGEFAAAPQTKMRLSPTLPNVGIAGARANKEIKRILEERGVNIAFDITCTNARRRFVPQKQGTLARYTHDVLTQLPCERMQDISLRTAFFEQALPQVDGLIYHTVQFCDMYSYEFGDLKRTSSAPLLALETDCTAQSRGQVLTRLEAFLESLEANRATPASSEPPATLSPKGASMSMHSPNASARKRCFIGIDSGSTSTNAVVIDSDKTIVASVVIRTGAKAGESAERAYREVIERAGLAESDITRTVATGYGRVSIPFADENVTEISCHGRGAHYFNPAVRTILDIGGQDSKAIHVNAAGEVTDFAMNDKCAAGTGRFLEMIARSLEMSLDELGPAALTSKKRLEIASMCSVFAESEVISLIANNEEKSDIATGVCRAVAGKAYSLMRRVGLEGAFMMTGGVAKNPGVVQAVEERIGEKLFICPEPEIVGATGAALLAMGQMDA